MLVKCFVNNGPQPEEQTDNDSNSGDALRLQIAATYTFVIAVPLYEIVGAALNIGAIHRIDGLQFICKKLNYFAGDERIELPTVVLETTVIPLN